MESTPSAAEVLKQLFQPVTVATDSKSALAGSVDVAAHSEDSKKQREHERKAEEADAAAASGGRPWPGRHRPHAGQHGLGPLRCRHPLG